MNEIPVSSFILYQDPELLVIDKPAGLPVLPDGWEKKAPYLVRMLEEQLGKVWVVHRLDKVTSGVMLLARTAEAHRDLNMQFQRHEVQKIYLAIVVGLPQWDQHTARHPLRTDVGHSHRTVVDDSRSKAAETTFRVLEKFQGTSLLEAIPTTGRTHQVRAHACALGFPLLGDSLYGAPPTDLISRPALHALSLTINHPNSGKSMTFTSPAPEDFRKAMEKLRTGR